MFAVRPLAAGVMPKFVIKAVLAVLGSSWRISPLRELDSLFDHIERLIEVVRERPVSLAT
jgi:hypothetical protein